MSVFVIFVIGVLVSGLAIGGFVFAVVESRGFEGSIQDDRFGNNRTFR